VDLFEPAPLIASFLIGTVGLALVIYGKRMSRFPHLLAGLALMIYPYFVPRLPFMIGIAAGILGLTWLATRLGW
jgi:hypothetical protein